MRPSTHTAFWRDPVLLLPLMGVLVAVAVLVVSWRDFANPVVSTLPTATPEPSDPVAVMLLEQMETVMNQLDTLKVIEVLKDDRGNTLITTTEYLAPDRVKLTTNTGSQSIGIGNQQWARTADEALWTTWTRGGPFVFPDFHYYSRQAVDVQMGVETQLENETIRMVTFAFLDFEGRFDFVVYADENTLLFRRLTMEGPGHHMVTDFVDYAPVVTIIPPPYSQIAPTPTVLVPAP
jgi:hypothetical protein